MLTIKKSTQKLAIETIAIAIGSAMFGALIGNIPQGFLGRLGFMIGAMLIIYFGIILANSA